MTEYDGNYLADTVASQWQHYRTRLLACRKQANEEAVHKLRTSIRRLLALISLLQFLLPQQELSKLRKALKAQLSALSELRDVQVMRLETSVLIGEFAQLEPFLHRLHLRELQLLILIPGEIAAWRSGKMSRKVKKIIGRCREVPLADGLDTQILNCIDDIYRLAQQRDAALVTSDLESFHKLRIATKKLRYSLELSAPLLPNLPSSHLQGIKTYLDYLGDIQNTTVFLHALEEFFGGEIPEQLLKQIINQQQDLLSAFLAQQNQLTTFWRQNAEQQLPWLN
jgi:CHAD domain-containing protein